MKKLLMAALVAVTVTTSAFAIETSVDNTAAARSFKVEFKKASDVTWSATDKFVKATFILNSEKMEAFYNADGDRIATSRAIAIEELPVSAKRTFAKKYDGYTVTQAIEFDGVEESAYFVSAENDKESVILKVTDASGISTYKRTRK